MAYNYEHGGNQEFNPYSNPQPHASYEPNPYGNYGPAYQDRSNTSTAYEPTGPTRLSSGFDRDEFAVPQGEKAMNFGQYRQRYRNENLWTKGGRVSCIGRYLCCTLMIAIFMIVSIVLALALWIRPPSIVIGSAGLSSGGSNAVQFQTSGITVPLEVNISVSNPNYFSVDLKQVNLDLTYPLNGNNTPIGNGTKSNVNFRSHTNTTFTFPFDIEYEFASDPTYAILIDMATKCGVLGSSQSDLTVYYKIKVDVHILVVTVSPTISDSFSISCPFDASTLKSEVEKLGLSSILGSL
jgi:hypothetical protein